MTPAFNEYGRLTAALVKHARDAFVSERTIDGQWRGLNFTAPPDFAAALDESDRFLEILETAGTKLVFLERTDSTTLDSIYTRDASAVSPGGIVLARMGKASRGGEPAAQQACLHDRGWPFAGAVTAPGSLEGGDIVWFDERTLAVGQGARTNASGIGQLRALLGDDCEMAVVPLPAYPGVHDVMHLMSLISPVDRDLAVVYPRLLPGGFRRWLADRGCGFVDVPDEEFETMGTNVLALGPRECVMVEGNPRTRAALERAGARVHVYAGREISLKGGGGPTCLTRPLARALE